MASTALVAGGAAAKGFVVNSNADNGDGVCDVSPGGCTLRDAIAAAADEVNNPGADDITFDLAESDRKIDLTTVQLLISSALTINGDVDGDGMPDITVDAQGMSRVFGVAPGAEATLQALVITGGSIGIPSDDGGGIFNSGTLTVEDSTISGNFAVVEGGGIFNRGTLTVEGSTVSGNSAASQGGGIMNNVGGTATVANSTISDNRGGLFGGGILNVDTATVTNSTISGNFAAVEGGGIGNVGALELKSTIVAGNTDADCFGPITSLGFNLDGDGTCGFTTVAVADVLVTLAPTDNGGPTETIALVDLDTNPNNPAVDAIPDADCDVDKDQRLIDRPQGAACDIGAFELIQDPPLSVDPVLELFDTAVDGGTLMGDGPGGSAAGRRNALRNQLVTAGALIAQGDDEAACAQLEDAAKRTDGASPPPDFVTGEAAEDLSQAIMELQDELECT